MIQIDAVIQLAASGKDYADQVGHRSRSYRQYHP